MGTSFINPIPRGSRSRYHESSRLRSERDSDVTPRAWQKNRSLEDNVFALGQALEQVQRELNRLRRRGGGIESVARQRNWFLGEWNSTLSVLAQQVVIFTPSGGQAGTYVCIVDAPIATEPSNATYYTLLPYPPPGVWGF